MPNVFDEIDAKLEAERPKIGRKRGDIFDKIDAEYKTEQQRPMIGGLHKVDTEQSGSNLVTTPERTIGGTAKDVGVSLVKGVVGAGEAVVGLANLATPGVDIANFAEKYVGYDPKTTQKFLSNLYSPAQQEANKRVDHAEGFVDTAAEYLKNPSTIVHGVVEAAPNLIGAGGIAQGLVKAAPKLATTGGRLVAAAIGEGAIGAGSAAENYRQETGELDPNGAVAAIGSGVVTGAINLAGGRIAKKLGFNDIDSLLAGSGTTTKPGNIASKIVKGGISEGAFEELPQSMQEQIWQNAALDRPLFESVPEAGAGGLILGSAMGAGANLSPRQGNDIPYSEKGDQVRQFSHQELVDQFGADQVKQIQNALQQNNPDLKPTDIAYLTKEHFAAEADKYVVQQRADIAKAKEVLGDETFNNTKERYSKIYPHLEDSELEGLVKTHHALEIEERITNRDTPPSNIARNLRTIQIRQANIPTEHLLSIQGDPNLQKEARIEQVDIDWLVEERQQEEQLLSNFKDAPSVMIVGAQVALRDEMNQRFAERFEKSSKAAGEQKVQQFTNQVLQNIDTEVQAVPEDPQQIGYQPDAGKESTVVPEDQRKYAPDAFFNDLLRRIDDHVKKGPAVDQQDNRLLLPEPAGENKDFTLVPENQRKYAVDKFFIDLMKTLGENPQADIAPKEERKLLNHVDFEMVKTEEAANRLQAYKSELLNQAVEAGLITDKDAADFEEQVIAQRQEWQRKNIKAKESRNVSQPGPSGKGKKGPAQDPSKTGVPLPAQPGKGSGTSTPGGEGSTVNGADPLPGEESVQPSGGIQDGDREVLQQPKEGSGTHYSRGYLDAQRGIARELPSSYLKPKGKNAKDYLRGWDEGNLLNSIQEKQPAEPAPKPDQFADNKVFTADAVAAARERLRAKRNTLNSGPDPELLKDVFVIGGAYFESGIRKFSTWAESVLGDIGSEFRPLLRGAYENLRYYPGIDTEGMSSQEEVAAYFENDQATEITEDIKVDEFSLQKLTGKTWNSAKGEKHVIGQALGRPEGWLEISVAGERSNQYLHIDDLQREIDYDEKRAKEVAAQEERQQAQEAEEAELTADYEAVNGFTDSLPKMMAGKVLKALNKEVSLNGEVLTRKAHIENLVRSGRTVVTSAKGERRLIDQEGHFIDEKSLTKTAMNYAEYLINQKSLESPATNTSQPTEEISNLTEELNNGRSLTKISDPPKEESVKQEQVTSEAKIDDVGEKLGGARKDLSLSLKEEYSQDDIASMPLSKIWPKPNTDNLANDFPSAFSVAARAAIPNKPRRKYRLDTWVKKVQALRDMAAAVLDGTMDEKQVERALATAPSLGGFYEKVKLYKKIDKVVWNKIKTIDHWPQAHRYVDGKQIPSPHLVVNRNRYQYQNSVDEVIPDVENDLQEISPISPILKFEIRGRATNGYRINKKGDPDNISLIDFTDLREARKYLKQNHSDLVNKWEQSKEKYNVHKKDVRRKDNRPRTGKDHRNGKDVAAEQFRETFGFRGVEFGNWVKQGKSTKERQGMVNAAYDALLDLSSILGIPPKAISLNGSLGLGFGSRGHGWASAHYEPGTLVINLTKTRGAGSLAHEFFHALDHYFQIQQGHTTNKKEGLFVTYNPEQYYISQKSGYTIPKSRFAGIKVHDPEDWKLVEKVRPEVLEKFATLVKRLDESGMYNRSIAIDKGKENGYWSQIIERAARAFEGYVISKMEAEGYNNDYLANVVSVEEFKRDESRYPYLTPEELPPVQDAFDELFSEIKTKSTDQGIALYKRDLGNTDQPHPPIRVIKQSSDVKDTAAVALLNRSINGERNTTVNKVLMKAVEVPQRIQSRANTLAGLFKKRVVFFQGGNPDTDPGGVTIRTSGDVVYVNVASGHHDFSIVGHELLHHLKMDQPEIYDDFLQAVQGILNVYAVSRYKTRLQGFDSSGKAVSKDLATEEMIADFIGDQFTNDQFWKDLAQEEPGLFRKIGKAVVSFLDKLIKAVKGIPSFESDDFFTDLTKARKAAVDAMAEYGRRQNENQLFEKVTPETLNTLEFKQWFGNSKIKSSNGRPVPVYHGSPKKFFTFDNSKAKTSTSSPMAELGHYFAMDKIEAMGYSRGTGNVGSYYVRLENPYVTTAIKLGNLTTNTERVRNLRKDLEAKGHDGIVLKDEGYLVLFDNKQVKSAERNTGGFDPGNTDVRYSPTSNQLKQSYSHITSLADLSPELKALSDEIRSRMADKRVSAPKTNSKLQVSHKQGETVLDRSKTDTGNISKTKVVKRFQGYEEMVARLKNDRTEAEEQAKLFSAYVKKFPRQVRGTFGLEAIPHKIIAARTPRRRLTLIRDGIRKIDAAHEQYTKRETLKKIADLIVKNEPKMQGRVQKQTAGGYDLYHELRLIKKVLALSSDEIQNRLENYAQILSKRVLSDKETLEFSRLATFGNLKNASAIEVQQAFDGLETMIVEKRMSWVVEMDQLKEEYATLRNKSIEVITGGKGLKTEKERQLDLKEKAKIARLIKDHLRSFDDLHQGWEWMLDKLSRYDKDSGILDSFLVKTFAPVVQRATRAEQAGLADHMATVSETLSSIYGGKTGRVLEKILNANTAIVEKTRVFRRDEQGRQLEEIPLSQNRAYKRWQEWQDPTLQEQLISQGYDQFTMDEIERFMTPEIKKWAEWQIDEFYPQYYGGVNEVFKKLFYTDMPFNESYSPVKRRYSKGQEDSKLLTTASPFSSLIYGAVMNRSVNQRDIELQDGDTALAQHITNMEHFKAWAQPMRVLRTTLGSEQVREAIRDYHGATALKTIDTFLNDFSRGRIAQELQVAFLQKLRAKFVTAAIGMNPVVFLKQLTSIPAFAMDMPASDWIKHLPATPGKWNKAVRTLADSGMLKARYGIGFERDMITAMANKVPGQMAGTKKLADNLMFLTKLGDKLAIVYGGYPVFAYNYDKAIKEDQSQEEALAFAMEQFEAAAERTQQAGNLKDLSGLQRGGAFAQMFTMFMTAPNAYYRQMSGAIRNLTGKGTDKKNAAKRLFIANVVLPMFFQAVASADFDDDEIIRAIALGPFNGLFLLREASTYLYDSMAGNKVWDTPGTPPVFSTLKEANTAFRQFKKMTADDWALDKDLWELVQTTSNIVGAGTGLPLGPTTRLIEGTYDAVIGNTTDPLLRSIGYSEAKLDTANKDYLSLRRKVADSGKKRSAIYRAVAHHDTRRAYLRKQLRNLQKSGASRGEILASRERLQEANREFVERWE